MFRVTLINLSALALWQGDETRALALARQALDIAVQTQARDSEVEAGLRLGDAERVLGRMTAARQAFTQARLRALEIDSVRQHDASAGLASVALAEGDTVAARTALQPLLEHVAAGGTLDGSSEPRLLADPGPRRRPPRRRLVGSRPPRAVGPGRRD